MTRLHGGPRRAGFTLIELLVVIAIISVLVGLLLSAVQNVRNSAEDQAVNDIQQMSTAIQNFKAKYRVDYIPSQVTLHENMQAYNAAAATQIEKDTADYLRRVWPHLPTGNVPRINWSGRPNFNPQNGNQTFTLQGDQCLVFFLGGIPRDFSGKQIPSGFSSNPSDPTSTSGVEAAVRRVRHVPAGEPARRGEQPVPVVPGRVQRGRGGPAAVRVLQQLRAAERVQPVRERDQRDGPRLHDRPGQHLLRVPGGGRPVLPAERVPDLLGRAGPELRGGPDEAAKGLVPPGSATPPAQDNVVSFIGGAATLGSAP